MSGAPADPADLTLSAAARLLAGRSLSATELLAAVLGRLDRTEPHVHAYAHVDREGALAAARAADAALAAAARAGSEPLSPLHGIPVGIKDVLPVEGLPLTGGSPAFAGHVAAHDAEAVRRLRAAGAVIVGMHVTHELATGQNVPPTRNAWRLTGYPGGSSAGGGVSVAVGSSLGAIGTDAGGSVRKPAALNNLTGLKATRGLVPRDGVLQPSGTLDHVGTLARTVEDTAHLLAALTRPQPGSAVAPGPAGGGGLRGARIGIDRSSFFGDGLDDAVRPSIEEALAELERQGATLVPVALPRIRELAIPAAFCILTGEAGASRGRLAAERPDALGEGARLMIELGTLLPARWTDAAQRARTLMRREAEDVFATQRLDLLVTPTMPITSLPLAEMEARTDLARTVLYTAAWNLTGQPALTVPCGFSPDGLPVGLQLVGRPYGEAALLAAGAAYQAATGWHERRPPLLRRLAGPAPSA